MRIPNQIKSTNLDDGERVDIQASNNGYAKRSCICMAIHVNITTGTLPKAQVKILMSITNLANTKHAGDQAELSQINRLATVPLTCI